MNNLVTADSAVVFRSRYFMIISLGRYSYAKMAGEGDSYVYRLRVEIMAEINTCSTKLIVSHPFI